MKYDGVFGGEWQRRVLRYFKTNICIVSCFCLGKWKLLLGNYPNNKRGREKKKHYLIFRYCMSNTNTVRCSTGIIPVGYH